MRPLWICVPAIEEAPKGFVTWRHSVAGVQRLRSYQENKFQCGRRVTDRYIETDEPPIFEVALCQTCMKSRLAYYSSGAARGRCQGSLFTDSL